MEIYCLILAGLFLVLLAQLITFGSTIFLKQQNRTIMGKQDQMNQAIERLGKATDEIASDMKKLRDEIAAGTVSDESLATLEGNIAKLEAIGAEDGETDPDAEQPLDGE